MSFQPSAISKRSTKKPLENIGSPIFGLTALAAGFHLNAAVRLFANPGQITGDFRLGAKLVDGVQFLEQGLVGEEAVQGFVAGLAQGNDFPATFRFGDEMVLLTWRTCRPHRAQV